MNNGTIYFTQPLSLKPFNTEVWVSSEVSVCGICGENSGTICSILQFYLFNIVPPIPHIHISTINVM